MRKLIIGLYVMQVLLWMFIFTSIVKRSKQLPPPAWRPSCTRWFGKAGGLQPAVIGVICEQTKGAPWIDASTGRRAK